MRIELLLFLLSSAILSGCAGIKVINPNDPEQKEANTKMVDWSGGKPTIVTPYRCRMNSMGKKYFALGVTEEEARKATIGKCRDDALINFCKEEDITCEQNNK
jgi:hypothetical protein